MATKSLGALTIDLIAKTLGFEQGMDKAARTADKRMREIQANVKKVGAAIGLALAGAATVAAAGIKSAIDYADQLNDMNQRLGVSAEALSGWAYAAKQTGTDIDALGIGLKKLAKNMAEAIDPKSDQARKFEALGISITDAAGNLRTVEDVLPEVASRFKELDNATLESALAMDLFGKSGTDLIEFLNQGGDGLAELRDRARELGVELDGNTLAAADAFNDTLADIKTIVQGLFTQLASALLPKLVEAAEDLRQMAKDGELAHNAVTILSTALDFGVGLLDEYNNAVARTSIAIEIMAGHLEGAAETAKNLATLGFADGSVLGGIGKSMEAWKNGQKQLDKLVADRELRAAGMTRAQYTQNFMGQFSAGIPGLNSQSIFPSLPFNFAESAGGGSGLERRLQAAYGPTGSRGKKGKSGKSDAARAAEEAARAAKQAEEAQRRWHDSILDMEATLAGPLAEAQRDYERSVAQLNEDYHNGQVTLADYAKGLELYAEKRDKDVEAINARKTPAQEMLTDMQLEISLLGKTRDEQDLLTAARYLGADAATDQGRAALAAMKQMQMARQVMEDQIGLQDELRESFQGFVSDVAHGASVWDALKAAFDRFADAIFEFASRKVMEQLFGQMGTSQSGSSGNWITGLISAFAGAFSGGGGAGASTGGSVGSWDPNVWGFASGGWMPANSFAEVNENGMEMASIRGRDFLLTGNSPVEITPNHRLGGGGGTNVTQNFYNPRMYDRRSESQRAAESGLKLRQATRFA